MQDALQPTLMLSPIRAAAPADGGPFEVLIRLQAPDRPLTHGGPARQPLRLARVIDRSGSMSGQPLHEALRCAEYICARWSPRATSSAPGGPCRSCKGMSPTTRGWPTRSPRCSSSWTSTSGCP